MAIDLDDDDVSKLARQLAEMTHLNETDAVRLALANEIARTNRARMPSLSSRVSALQARVETAAGPNAQPVDRAFIDSLYES